MSFRGQLGWLYLKHFFGCQDILILSKSPIKWRQRPDMNIAIDWDVRDQFNKQERPTETIKSHYGYTPNNL